MTPEAVAVICAALAAGAFAKGLTGLGLPPVAIAILSAFFDVEHAIVVATIPVAFANILIIWLQRDRIRQVPRIWLPFAVAAAGVAAGTWVLANIDGRALTIVLAAWIAVFLLTTAFGLTIRAEGRGARIASPLIACAAGISQGATGFSGPFIATWGHALGFAKETYVLATSLLFASVSVTHLLTVGAAGLYDGERAMQGVLAVIPVLIFTPLGMRLARRISVRVFNYVILGVIGAMEVKLVWGLVADG